MYVCVCVCTFVYVCSEMQLYSHGLILPVDERRQSTVDDDAHYVNALLQYVNKFCVQLRDHVMYISADNVNLYAMPCITAY